MKLFSKTILSLLATAALAGTAKAADADFVGTWVNTNASSSGIIRLVISPSMQIRAFGQCHPTACDFGLAPLITYGRTVSDTNHNAATALYNFSFKQDLLVAKLVNRRMLTLEDYNRFTDSSGRQNYWMSQRFRKATAAELSEDFASQNTEPEQ